MKPVELICCREKGKPLKKRNLNFKDTNFLFTYFSRKTQLYRLPLKKVKILIVTSKFILFWENGIF